MQVPIYETNIQRELPQVNQPPAAAFGGQVTQAKQSLGEAMQGIGVLMEQRAFQRQQENDNNAILNAEVNFRKEMDDVLYNPDGGIMNRSLMGADGATAEFGDKVEELKQKYSETLGSDAMKLQFSQLAEGHASSALDNVARMEASETKKGKLETLNSSLALNASDVAKNPTADNLSFKNDDSAQKLTVTLSQMGYDEESINNQIVSAVSNNVKSAVGSYLSSGDWKGAQTILDAVTNDEKYKDKVDGNLINQLKEDINQKKLPALSRQYEDDLKLMTLEYSKDPTEENLNKYIDMGTRYIAEISKQFDPNITDDSINLKQQNYKMTLIDGGIQALVVKGDTAGAQKMLNAYKSELPMELVGEAQNKINEKSFDNFRDNLWSKMSEFVLPDGTTDLNKMQDYFSKQNIPDELKDKVWDGLKEKANERDSIVSSQRQANKLGALDAASSVFQNSGSKEQALNSIGAFKLTPYDKQQVIEYIDGLYKPKHVGANKGNPEVYMMLWKGNQDGTTKQDDIDNAYSNGLLSDSQWMNLSKENYNEKLHPTDPYTKGMWEDIREDAVAMFGNSTVPGTKIKRVDAYMHEVKVRSNGLTPDQTREMANQMLTKIDKNKGYAFENAFNKDNAEIMRKDQGSIKWQRMYQFLGKTEVMEIGKAAVSNGKREWGIEDVENFYASLGYPITWVNGKPVFGRKGGLFGTGDVQHTLVPVQVHNAIKSIIAAGYPLTAENVKGFLKKYPSGIMPSKKGK